MKIPAIFYHAGCPVCVSAENQVVRALDRERYDIQIIHLGEQKNLLSEAKNAGVVSVPALVIDGQPFHINYGADISILGR
ncbi:MAG: thioredoxin family protein [Opitutaceae bacterium]|nr:thioredoxin family protein [Cephaloticoccus sp.]MCP5530458.1 thioredoxin family protein [Opitutaceae bacterium]